MCKIGSLGKQAGALWPARVFAPVSDRKERGAKALHCAGVITCALRLVACHQVLFEIIRHLSQSLEFKQAMAC
jgi:hypothetical protein